MNIALQAFQVRETYEPVYSAPTLDVLDDSGNRDITPPAQPVMAWAFVGQVRWLTVATALTYKIQKKSGPGGVWTDLFVVEAGSGAFQVLDSDQFVPSAFYRVIAVNAAGESVPSNPMFIAPPPIGDIAPEPPTIIPDSEVSWNITADGFTARWAPQAGVTDYFIDLGPDNDPFYPGFDDLNIGLVHEYTFTGLSAPASFWTFRVRANMPFAPSDSSTVLVTPGT